MAIVTTTKILVDGPKLTLVQFTGFFPSTGGEETDAVKINALALVPVPTSLKIMRLWYSNTAPGTILEFDGVTDGLALPLLDDGTGYLDFRSAGGLRDTSTTPSGDITLTTLGTAVVGSGYTILIEVSKS